MKRFYIVLFLLMNLVSSIMGQVNVWEMRTPPKDSLSDLWIVTVDVSKSMLDFRQGLSSVPDKVESMIASNCVKGKQDVYALQLSGANKEVLLTKNGNSVVYDDKGLMSDLIHKTRFFSSLDELIKNLGNTVGNSSSFVYNMSFTSLIRPLSIYELVLEDDMDFGLFRNVYHILVTDDGDINDQWMQDYKWMRKWAPKHFSQFNEIISHVACSEFDFTSRKAGKFVEITSSVQQPRIYLTEYVTYQNNIPDIVLPADSLVEVCDFHDDHLVFQMQPCDSCIGFVYLRNCFVNGDTIEVNQYLYPGNQLLVTFDTVCTNMFGNNVSIEGTYQEHYDDRVLGWRFRTVGFNGNLAGTFVSAETKAAGWKYLKVVVALVLAILLFIIVWRNLVVLRIYVNGKCWSIKRKAMNKLKNDDYNVVTVVCNEYRMTEALFFKGKGISVTDDNSTEKWENKVILESPFHEIMPIGPKRFEKNVEKKRTFIGFDLENLSFDSDGKDNWIQFSYSDKHSHNLIISFEKEKMVKAREGDKTDDNVSKNKLRECNIDMLARYYEDNADKIDTICNNVQVNIIRKESLGADYTADYAILNIYDLNCRNKANHVFLRYSIMCSFDRINTTEAKVTSKLLNVACNVLKSERKKQGYFEKDAYTDLPQDETGVVVNVSPLLTYLYLLKESSYRLLYSPFSDGRPPCSDGHYGIENKTVRIFPKATMTLLNLPVKHKNPAIKKEDDNTIRHINPIPRKTEVLYFKGRDRVVFNNVEKDYACGANIGGLFLSWSLDDIVFETTK